MAFYPCTNNEIDKLIDDTLTEIRSFVTNTRAQAFMGCTNLVSVDLPNAITLGQQTFRDCTSLVNVNIPLVTYFASLVFRNCTSLVSVDLPRLGNIGTSTFQDCVSLTNVVLRKTDNITTLSNVSVFQNTPFVPDGSGGKIYVPQALIASYQANATWVSLLSQNPNNQILAIEGSPYEN